MSNVTVEINGRETVSQAALAAKNGLAGVSAEAKNTQGAAAGLSSETGKLNGMFGGFVITAGDVVNAVKAIAQAAWGTIEAFAKQEKSIAQFSAAMSLSGRITNEQADGLREYAEEMANLTGEDDEAILSMEAFLAASGRNETQIRKLISAAADYSAATGKGMRTSVEELNKTFSGTEGRLGMLIPALKDLTDEQLKAGKGIDVVAAQYDGFASKMSGIADVSLKNFKNAYDDVVAAIGAEVWPALAPAVESVTKFMQEKMIPGIKTAFNVLSAVFQNIPELSKVAFSAVSEIIRLTFSWDGLGAIFTTLGNYVLNTFNAALGAIPDMFLDIVGLMFNPITQLGLYIADTIGKAFSGKGKEIASPGDFMAKLFETQVAGLATVASNSLNYFQGVLDRNKFMAAEMGDFFYPTFSEIAARFKAVIQPTLDLIDSSGTPAPGGGSTGATTAYGAFVVPGGGRPDEGGGYAKDYSFLGVNNAIKQTFDYFGNVAKETRDDMESYGWTADALSKPLAEFRDDLESYGWDGLGETAADRIRKGWAKGIDAGARPDEGGGYSGTVSSGFPLWRILENWAMGIDAGTRPEEGGITGSGFASDLRGSAASFAGGGTGADMQYLHGETGQQFDWLTRLGQAISPIADKFLNMITPLASIQAILNPVTTILQAMFDVLGPLINTVLQPIVGILRVVGTTLGQILAPVISALGPVTLALGNAFVWLYNNVIRHVGNGLITVFNFLYNAAATFVNGILKAYNWMNNLWGGKDAALIKERELTAGYLQAITMGTVMTAGTTTYSGGTTGASATYQKPRDITVNVQVNTSALVGDGGIADFALIIGRELRSAGVLGMA